MAEVRSAVALIETAGSFVLQRRPNLPGLLAYPGRLQFLGGGVSDGETFDDAVLRELGEETDLEPEMLRAELIWEGPYVGEDRNGQPVSRHVGLFRVCVDHAFGLREQGELVHVPSDAEGIEQHAHELTPFAYHALRYVIGVEDGIKHY